MKQLNVSTITDSSQLPIKSGTLQFLQDMNSELFKGIMIALIGPGYNAGTVYILSGAGNTGTAPAYNIATGFAFYNGELFYIPASAFTVSGGNTAIFSILTTQYAGNGVNADPVTFTDASVQNIHNIRQLQVTGGASGAINYSAAINISFAIPAMLNLTAPLVAPYADNVLQLIGDYPNYKLYVPSPSTNNFPIVDGDNQNLGSLVSGGSVFTINFHSARPNTNYLFFAMAVSGDATAQQGGISFIVRSKGLSSVQLWVYPAISVFTDISLDWYIIQLS